MYYEKIVDGKFYYLFRRCVHDGDVAPPYSTPSHCHEGHELLVIVEGEAEAVLNGERRILCAGDILFLDSYDIHSFVFNKCVRYTLVFSKEYSRMLGVEKTLPNYPACDEKSFGEIVAVLDRFYALYGPKLPNTLIVEGLVSTVLGIIEACSGKTVRENKHKALMVGVLEYIGENFDSELTLDALSAKFGYSPTYFSSLFNRFVQMNFKDYLNYVRYRRASELIREGKMSATDAAIKCGFGSMNTFYRAKRKFEREINLY